jgi:hypothetical protein
MLNSGIRSSKPNDVNCVHSAIQYGPSMISAICLRSANAIGSPVRHSQSLPQRANGSGDGNRLKGEYANGRSIGGLPEIEPDTSPYSPPVVPPPSIPVPNQRRGQVRRLGSCLAHAKNRVSRVNAARERQPDRQLGGLRSASYHALPSHSRELFVGAHKRNRLEIAGGKQIQALRRLLSRFVCRPGCGTG